MKLLLSTLILSTSLLTFASTKTHMSQKAQESYVQDLAKEVRKELWVSGYDYVHSSISIAAKKDLNEYFSDKQHYESKLSAYEIEQTYSCVKSRICRVFIITTSSEYMSGYGVDANVILLEIKNRTHHNFRHTVYSE